MHTNRPARLIILASAAFILAAAALYAQDAPAIRVALDRQADLELANVTLAQAIEKVRDAMDVPVEIDPEAIRQLAHAGETRLAQVRFAGMTWGDALRELLDPMLLTYEVGPECIYVLGTPELMRQPQPVNSVEREALVALREARLTDHNDHLLDQIRSVTRMPFGLIENGRRRDKADDDIAEDILTKTPQLAHKVLNEYSRRIVRDSRDGAWYVQAKLEYGQADQVDIVILPARDITSLKLQRRVDLEFKNASIQRVLQALADQAGLDLNLQPGCLALLDPRVRENISLSVKSGTVLSALEAISGLTGLEFEPTSQGLSVSAGDVLRQMAQKQTELYQSANPTMFVIQHKVPGTGLETMIMVRQQDLVERGLLDKYQTYQRDSVDQFLKFLQDYQPTKPDETP